MIKRISVDGIIIYLYFYFGAKRKPYQTTLSGNIKLKTNIFINEQHYDDMHLHACGINNYEMKYLGVVIHHEIKISAKPTNKYYINQSFSIRLHFFRFALATFFDIVLAFGFMMDCIFHCIYSSIFDVNS